MYVERIFLIGFDIMCILGTFACFSLIYDDIRNREIVECLLHMSIAIGFLLIGFEVSLLGIANMQIE